jgi:NitT/TauT family transport system substrate-binding protein
MLFLPPAAALAEEKTLNVGYFPNITHAQALVAQNMAAEGRDWYAEYLPGVTLKWHSFNAGPSAMEALFAKAVDLSYVGPGPVLNAYLRSKGGVTVLSGAVRGGAGLVVPKDSPLKKPEDFKGRRIATPQLGNTQDIACRSWLTQAGLKVTMGGGDVSIVPTANPGILPLFIQGEVDGAWTVEPWLSRLEMEGGGKLIYAEPPETSLTTVLSAGERALKDKPELVAGFSQGHRALTEWIIEHPSEAQKRVADELTRQMRREFPQELVERAWPRLVFDNGVGTAEFEFSLKAAQDAGFIKAGEHDVRGLVGTE